MVKNCVMNLFLAVIADDFAQVLLNLANTMAFTVTLL